MVLQHMAMWVTACAVTASCVVAGFATVAAQSPPPSSALFALAGNWVGELREVKNADMRERCGDGTVAIILSPTSTGRVVGEYLAQFFNPECNMTGALAVSVEGYNIIVRIDPTPNECFFNIQGTVNRGNFQARYESHGCGGEYIGFVDFERYRPKTRVNTGPIVGDEQPSAVA